MAGTTIWKGNISFGEANIPVKLHSAIKEEQVRFHLLHKIDHVKLRQQMVCSLEREPVPPEAQVKGFEVEEGKYLIVDPKELEEATPESSRMIEVHEFVEVEQVDPIFLERAYYLEPDDHTKRYNALAAAMTEMDVLGICTWAMRKRSYLGALYARGRSLRLEALRYADEVVQVRSLELQNFLLSQKEVKIAGDLINHLSGPFRPDRFENEHVRKLRGLIDRKARGEKIAVLRPKRLKPTQPDKLLQALEASLKEVA